MLKKLTRQNSKVFHGAQVYKAQSSESQNYQEPVLDRFEVRVSSSGINTQLLNKINKAMRSEVNADEVYLGQWFSRADIINLSSLSEAKLQFAYLEGIYAAGRYCALVDPSEDAVQRNAQAVMARYLKHLKHPHSEEKLYWIKKDYCAGTAGEDVVTDAKLLEQAKSFIHHLLSIDKSKDLMACQKKLSHIINHDANPLAAFIALRRALFALTNQK